LQLGDVLIREGEIPSLHFDERMGWSSHS
jgi:hypothetical protein